MQKSRVSGWKKFIKDIYEITACDQRFNLNYFWITEKGIKTLKFFASNDVKDILIYQREGFSFVWVLKEGNEEGLFDR